MTTFRRLVSYIILSAVSFLFGMYLTMRALDPVGLEIVAVYYAAESYNLGCMKHEIENTDVCIKEAREYYKRHLEALTK